MRSAFWTWTFFLAMGAVSSAPVSGAADERAATAQRRVVRQTGEVSTDRPQWLSAARMRYRRLHGRWWYWLPSEQWALWDGKQWTVDGKKVGELIKVAGVATRAPKPEALLYRERPP